VADALLARSGHPAELRIGVVKTAAGGLQGHAWVESNGRVVVGNLPDLSSYTPFPPLPKIFPRASEPRTVTLRREAIVEPSCAPSGFGFRVRCLEPLRFLRSGGGVETLEVVVAARPRTRPDAAPLVDWTLAGPERRVRGTLYQLERGFEFWATDVGAYRIDPEAGRIEMPTCDDDVMREQRLWGIPAALCFMHRGDVPLHAAAVEVDGGAVLLAAPRRHGKTTLALAFQRHGHRLLSEDLACCRLGPVPTVLPGPALLRIRPDIYDGRPPAGTHVAATRGDRTYLALDEDRTGSSAPVPIVALVLLRESSNGISFERVSASAAIRDLWTLSFRLPGDAARARTFTQLTRLADALPCWNLYRPVRLGSLDATVTRIVEVCRP
jgi:hypothetical protein